MYIKLRPQTIEAWFNLVTGKNPPKTIDLATHTLKLWNSYVSCMRLSVKKGLSRILSERKEEGKKIQTVRIFLNLLIV